MSSSPQWRDDPDEVERRLNEIGGLTSAILREVAIQGEIGRASCTANHPPLASGFNCWADATRALRDLLLPLGWQKSDEGGYAITLSPDGKHAVVVATGDEHTASRYFAPKTKSPKGPRTQEVVATNAFQRNLFMSAEEEEAIIRALLVERRVHHPSTLTWMVLIARTEDALLVEMSLPDLIGEDGRPERWPERLILGAIPLDDGPSTRRAGPDQGPDFDVDVTRRTA